MKKYVAEIIGTFALVFCGPGAIVINDVTGGSVTHVGVAITFGLVVMAMIYSLGDISGSHINPAVTIAFWVAGKFEGKEVLPYITAQLIGALLSCYVLKFLFPEHPNLGATLPSGSASQSFVLEIILTYFLMLVIIGVTSGTKELALLAGVAIGGTVMFEAMFAGPITGASMNPARSIGPAVISGKLQYLWLYIAAPIIGSVSAVITYKFIKNDD